MPTPIEQHIKTVEKYGMGAKSKVQNVIDKATDAAKAELGDLEEDGSKLLKKGSAELERGVSYVKANGGKLMKEGKDEIEKGATYVEHEGEKLIKDGIRYAKKEEQILVNKIEEEDNSIRKSANTVIDRIIAGKEEY